MNERTNEQNEKNAHKSFGESFFYRSVNLYLALFGLGVIETILSIELF